jgi:hypothetical protein
VIRSEEASSAATSAKLSTITEVPFLKPFTPARLPNVPGPEVAEDQLVAVREVQVVDRVGVARVLDLRAEEAKLVAAPFPPNSWSSPDPPVSMLPSASEKFARRSSLPARPETLLLVPSPAPAATLWPPSAWLPNSDRSGRPVFNFRVSARTCRVQAPNPTSTGKDTNKNAALHQS